MHASAVAALREAVTAIGLSTSHRSVADTASDVTVVCPDGSILTFEVKASALPSFDWVDKIQADSDHVVVVADQIPHGVREWLNDHGVAWFDRRGHLRLVRDGLFVDADIPRAERSPIARSDRAPISGRSGLAAAAALLMRPDDPMGVSEVARFAGLNASSISRAMASIATAQLSEQVGRGRYRPLVPELFWALADVWPRERASTSIRLFDLDKADLRHLGMNREMAEHLGWAMSGERGAVAWGAPLILTGDYPTFLYVPNEQVVRSMRALVGDKRDEPAHAIALAVDPSGLIVSHRHRAPGDGRMPLAHPLFCALDLTATSRDREALDQWNPPEEFTRVW